MSPPVPAQDQHHSEVSSATRPSPSWLNWLCWILGGLLLVGLVAMLPVLALFTYFAIKAFKIGTSQTLENALLNCLEVYTFFFVMAWGCNRLLRRAGKASRAAKAPTSSAPAETMIPTQQPAPRAIGKNTRWSFCNVLDVGANARRLWQFDGQKFALSREQTARNGEQLPPNIVGKSWGALFQKKLNVAWLPPEQVFLRVAQFPMSTPEETRAMVELQLEKLSPIPVTQALWTMHVLPQTAPRPGGENLQTIIVTVVAREAVEEFLGKLEGQGYMSDRLELPMLDQLQATRVSGDGAWVYPDTRGPGNRALVAWWYGGVLQNLAFLSLESSPTRIASLKDQMVQMTWAGELEGWLTSAPRWHLVTDSAEAWQSALREALDQPVEVLAPLPAQELAALTARRAAQSDANNSLMPPEFAARYQQQFVDRLWGRGLLAALVIYGIGLAIFFVALEVFKYRAAGVQTQAEGLSQDYTNSLQAEAMLKVLTDRESLRFAALDCYDAVAQTMPTGLQLETMTFTDGTKLGLRGTAPADQLEAVSGFFDKLRKWENKDGQALFEANEGGVPSTQLNPGGATLTWSFDLDLKGAPKR